jgi:hypothetical protein
MFKFIVWFSAIFIALCAAFFSVTGIATLFSGKFYAVLVMAASLEVGKLVAASFLYRYWKGTPRPLKGYLISGVVVLMMITSLGIYAYLSAAYASIASVPQNTLNQITAVESRQTTLNDNITRWANDNNTLGGRQAQAQRSLDNVLAGNTELSQRSAFANLRNEIAQLDAERRTNQLFITTAQSERDSLETVKVGLNAELNTNSKIGTFVYIARALNVPLDTVVKWFVLVIVFVFDPLAVSLILAYNNIVMRERKGQADEIDPGMEVMARPFSNLRKRMSANRVSVAHERTKSMLAAIPATPTVTGKDADAIQQEIVHGTPDTPDRIMHMRHADQLASHIFKREPKHLINYDEHPFFERPGYDWKGRRAEWERHPDAVEYYRMHIKPTLDTSKE